MPQTFWQRVEAGLTFPVSKPLESFVSKLQFPFQFLLHALRPRKWHLHLLPHNQRGDQQAHPDLVEPATLAVGSRLSRGLTFPVPIRSKFQFQFQFHVPNTDALRPGEMASPSVFPTLGVEINKPIVTDLVVPSNWDSDTPVG
jgi:hypothetical protein